MGALSNQLLVATIVLYIFAMLAYAVEWAFGARGAVARVAGRQLVSAGQVMPTTGQVNPAETAPAQSSPAAGEPGEPAPPSRLADAAGRVGVLLTVLALALHAATLVTRGLAAGRVPWGNLYEFVLVVSFVGGVAWMVVLTRRTSLRHLGLFVALAIALMLGVAGMNFYTPAGPLMPALQSYWLLIHVTAASIAAGVLLVGFIAAALHLVRLGYESGQRRFPYGLGNRLPDADTLERLTFRVHAFAFPIWTFAVICGAIWAKEAWSRYWGWDPKETWSFVAWVIYASYLHARSTPSVSRRITSWIAIAGWVAMMINLVGVNLVVSGLHSYAGVK